MYASTITIQTHLWEKRPSPPQKSIEISPNTKEKSKSMNFRPKGLEDRRKERVESQYGCSMAMGIIPCFNCCSLTVNPNNKP